MVFSVNPRQFNRKMVAFPQKFLLNMKQEQSLNESQIMNTPKPQDPVVEQMAHDTTPDELGESKPMVGEGFRVRGGRVRRSNNDKLRKFISLKL